MFLCLIKVPLIIIGQLQGFFLFIILNQLGVFIMQTKLKSIFNLISTNSFYVFLFQHMVIVHILYIVNPTNFYFVIPLLVLTVLVTVLVSFFYGKFIKYILSSKMFTIVEKKLGTKI